MAKKTTSLKTKHFFHILLIIGVAICCIVIGIYFVSQGEQFINIQAIGQLQRYIRSYGTFSPFIIFLLILLSTMVPPLPVPLPVVELAAGVVFGFWQGFIIVWISQIISSVVAFYMMRIFQKKVSRLLSKSKYWRRYHQYVVEKGALAVFLSRFTMSAPFNIVSFLAGLTDMDIASFLWATILGTIPESVLSTFIGSGLTSSHLSLWYLFVFSVVLGSFGFIVTFYVMQHIRPQIKKVSLPS